MFVLFGTNNPKCNTIAFKGVTRIYISIVPKDDKTKYIKIEDIESPMTPSSKPKENINTKCVYVVEFFDNSEPKVLPTDEFVIDFINEKDSPL